MALRAAARGPAREPRDRSRRGQRHAHEVGAAEGAARPVRPADALARARGAARDGHPRNRRRRQRRTRAAARTVRRAHASCRRRNAARATPCRSRWPRSNRATKRSSSRTATCRWSTATIFEDVQAAVDADAGTALGLVTAQMPLPSSFGRVIRNGTTVEKIVEFRDCTTAERAIDEMNAGIYAFDERALRAVIGRLDDNNAQGELYLTDTIGLLVAASYRVVAGAGRRLPPGPRRERPRRTRAARATMNERLCEAHMRNGVTIVDPATTYLEPGLEIGADTVIAPNTGDRRQLGHRRAARASARTRAFATPASPTTCASPRASCSTRRSATRATIGPFAHLRARQRASRRRAHRQLRRAEEDAHRRPASRRATSRISAMRRSARTPTSAPARSRATTTA